MRREFGALAAIVLCALLALGACEPCAGVSACRTTPHVSISGQVIEYETGKPVQGVAVSFSPIAGGSLGGPISGSTDALGRFELTGIATAVGSVVGTLSVRSPTFPAGYDAAGIRVTSSSVRGEGTELGRILARPYFAFLGEVKSRKTGASAVSSVHFTRVGGASLPSNDFVIQTDTNGRFFLERPASANIDFIADVTLTSPGDAHSYVYPAAALPIIWRDQVPQVDRVFSLGLSLFYAVQAVHRGLEQGVPGVQFSFTRTGGIAATPTSLSGLTNEIGLFSLKTDPATDGVLVGDIVMTPPAPFAPQSYRGVRLQTFDTDEIRLLASYRFGQAARYAGELFNRATGQLQSDVEVEFRPTGGVSARARRAVSNQFGRFLIAPFTDQSGEIIGDLIVQYLPPRAPEIISGVKVRTWEDDSLRYLQRWGVGPSLQYVGELRRDDNNAPIVGAQVTFVRTGGIDIAPSTLNSTSIDGGRFSLNLAPSTDGEVAGKLTVHPGGGLRDTTFAITLPTYLSDEVRLRAVWKIKP